MTAQVYTPIIAVAQGGILAIKAAKTKIPPVPNLNEGNHKTPFSEGRLCHNFLMSFLAKREKMMKNIINPFRFISLVLDGFLLYGSTVQIGKWGFGSISG